MQNDPMRELKVRRIWFPWIWHTKENGEVTKVPVAAKGGATGTSDNYKHTWVTYDEAVAAMKKRNAPGVGFIIPEGYFFEDIDHLKLDDPYVQKMIKRFDSYTEYSQSGEGIHIYGKVDISKLPTVINKDGKLKLDDKVYYIKNQHNNTEFYIGGLTGRFACYTGNVILNEELKERTEEVLITLNNEMLKANFTKKRSGRKANDQFTKPTGKNADEIVEELKRQKNGVKFMKLYVDGNIEDYNNDDSAADCALVSLIAFRTGNDPDLIYEIIQKSALMRDKWNRDDYRERTIRAGVEALNGQFHRSVKVRPYFIEYIESKGIEVIVPTKLAKHVRENLHYIFVRDNAKEGVLTYVYENGCYRLYSVNMMIGRIKQFVVDYDEHLVSMGKIHETYSLITTDLIFVSHEDIDANENIINFQNGLLNITTMELLPHTPDELSTIQIPCNWVGHPLPTPVFDGFMNTLTSSNQGEILFVNQFGGVCISNVPGHRMKKAIFQIGKGNTGKTLLISLIQMFLGRENYISIDLRELEARFGAGTLYGKRLAGCSDMSFIRVTELKAFKMCTGGDPIFVEFKGENGFTYRYRGILWFCANQLPKFSGDDGEWVYDRIAPLFCNNVIPPEKRDKLLLEKMYAEREGIIYKFVMALKMVIANGYNYTEPESVIHARMMYRYENNTVIAFYHECMQEREDGKITDHCTTGKVYDVYKAWCADNNHGYYKTAREFRNTLAEHLNTRFAEMTVRRGKGGTFYRSITLKDEVKEHYHKAYGYDGTEFLAD